jgi:hypothetical protein
VIYAYITVEEKQEKNSQQTGKSVDNLMNFTLRSIKIKGVVVVDDVVVYYF